MSPEKFEPKVEAPVDKEAERGFPRPMAAEEQNIPAAPLAAIPAPEEEPTLDRDEEVVMIENILSENIADLYRQLSADKQRAFRKRGEEVALKIKGLLKQTRVRAHELLRLIKEWLKMLPGISYYFLEQEAKIKTDKVLQMKREGQEIER